MAQVKISELPSASSLTGSEVLPIVQGGSTLGATVNQIKDKVQASAINVLKMNASSVQTLANIGELAFNPDTQTLELKCSADVTLSIGQENYIRGKNAESSTILNGTVVYVSGGLGANSLIKRAGNADGTAERVIGIATQDIGANNIGFITTSGVVNKLDTSAYIEGDLLWLGTNGAMTDVKPDTSVDQICIGVVLRSHATQGSLLVAVKDDWRDKLAEVRSDLNAKIESINLSLTKTNENGYFWNDGGFVVNESYFSSIIDISRFKKIKIKSSTTSGAYIFTSDKYGSPIRFFQIVSSPYELEIITSNGEDKLYYCNYTPHVSIENMYFFGELKDSLSDTLLETDRSNNIVKNSYLSDYIISYKELEIGSIAFGLLTEISRLTRVRTKYYYSVQEGDLIKLPKDVSIHYYDHDLNYISNTAYSQNDITINVPQGVSFVKFLIVNSDELDLINFDGVINIQSFSNKKNIINYCSNFIDKKILPESNIDISNLTLERQTVTNTGEVINHDSRYTIKEYIPINEYTSLSISSTDGYYYTMAAFYKKNEYGLYEFIPDSYYSNYKSERICNSNEYVKITFVWMGGAITTNDVLTKFTINASSGFNLIEKATKLNTFKEVLVVNDYTSYKQGNNGVSVLNKCDTLVPFLLEEGTRYIVDCSGEKNIGGIGITVGESPNNISTWIGWVQAASGSITITESSFIVPHGMPYCRITLLSNSTITPSIASDCNVKLIKSSTTNFITNDKFVELIRTDLRYAQGMAICNDLIFQSYSDGTIDIHSLDGTLVYSNVQVPLFEDGEIPHCNNIAFGPKDESSDVFNTLWISSNNDKMMVVKLSQSDNTINLAKLYELNSPVGGTQYFDFESKKMAIVSYDNSIVTYGDMLINIYSVDDWQQSSVFTELKNFKLNKMWAAQSGILKGEHLFIVSGTRSGGAMRINDINIEKEEYNKIINLRDSGYTFATSEEAQAYCVYKGIVYFTTTEGIYILS